MVKKTFTFDEATEGQLRLAAKRTAKSQSYVVREAIRDYAATLGKLSERERLRMLDAFDRLSAQVPYRSRKEVDAEIRSIRAARRTGGRRHPVE